MDFKASLLLMFPKGELSHFFKNRLFGGGGARSEEGGPFGGGEPFQYLLKFQKYLDCRKSIPLGLCRLGLSRIPPKPPQRFLFIVLSEEWDPFGGGGSFRFRGALSIHITSSNILGRLCVMMDGFPSIASVDVSTVGTSVFFCNIIIH